MHPSQKPSAIVLVALLAGTAFPLAVEAVPAGCALGINELHWHDLDHNGHLDAVRVVTNNPVETDTIYPSDWNFGGSGAPRRGTGLTLVSGTEFWIFFPESDALDGGAPTAGGAFAPPMAYQGYPDGKVHIRAPGGNPNVDPTPAIAATCFSNGAGVTNHDKAPPLLLAAYGQEGGTSLVAVFSEFVTFDTGAYPNAQQNFCFVDHTNTQRLFTGAVPTAASKAVTLTFAGGYGLHANDVAVGGFSNPPVTASTGRLLAREGGVCDNGATQSFSDQVPPAPAMGGGNPGIKTFRYTATWTHSPCLPAPAPAASCGSVGAVPVGGPFPIAVHGSIGSRTVTVEFNGPVTNGAGSSITSGFSTAQWTRPAGPGVPPAPDDTSAVWAVQSATHTHSASSLGQDRVLLSTDRPLPPFPHHLFIQPSSIRGAGSTAEAPPSSTWRLTDTGHLSRPRLTDLRTVDGDANGCVDAIRLVFNEPVTDPATAAGFSVYFPTDDTATSTLEVVTGGVGTPGSGAIIPAQPNEVLYQAPMSRLVADATFGSGSFRVNSASNGFQPSDVGRPVSGTGIAAGATILNVAPSGAYAVLSAATTAAAASPGDLNVDRVTDDATLYLVLDTGNANTPGHAECRSTAAAMAAGYAALPRVTLPSTLTDRLGNALFIGVFPPVATTPASPTPEPAGAPAMAFQSALDGAPPALLAVATRDCLAGGACVPNGRLDGIQLTFSEPVAAGEVRAQDWQVQAASPCSTSGTAPGFYTVTGTQAIGTTGTEHGLALTEIGTAFDTGCIPDVVYTGASGTPQIKDACPSGWASVAPSPCTNLQPMANVQRGPGLAGNAQITAYDATSGTATATVTGTQVYSNGVQVGTLAGLAPGMVLQVTQAPPGSPAVVGTFTVGSVNVGAGTFTYAARNPGTIPPAIAIRFHVVASQSEVDRAGPVLLGLSGTIGSNQAEATFSEKPCGWTAPAAPDPTCPPNQVAAFQYVNNPPAGSPGGVVSIIGVAEQPPEGDLHEDNELTLTLNAPLTSDDVGANRDCVRLVGPTTPGIPGTASGVGLTDIGPGAASLPASGYNLPYPRASPACVSWGTGTGAQVTAVTTLDSNLDGYLDALRITFDQPIRDGTRLLRADSADNPTVVDGDDHLYFDGGITTPPDGAVSAGDFRFTNGPATCMPTCAAGTTVAGGDGDVGLPLSPSFNVLWADLAGVAATSTGDALYGDVDHSGNVTNGDFRYLTATPPGAGTVSCTATSRDADCGARIPASGYVDVDKDGFVSHQDTRSTPPPTLAPGAVSCPASGVPNWDCGRALTPTSRNLVAADFSIGVLLPTQIQPVVTCVLSGKAAGPVLGGSTPSGSLTSCPGGITGVAEPLGGHVPAATDSCAGNLPSGADDTVIFVCFSPWRTTPNPPQVEDVAIPNTGFRPQLTYTPSGSQGGTIRSAATGLPVGGFTQGSADGARPVLVQALVEGGSRQARLRFSEPVGASVAATSVGGTSLSATDLAYINGNAGTAYCRSGADSIATVGTLPAPANAGATAAQGLQAWEFTVTLRGNLSHEDIVGCIQNPAPASPIPARDGIRAAGSLLERGAPLAAVAKFVPFTDLDRPRIAEAAFVDANGDGTVDAVRVRFTEPVNDCFMSRGPPTSPYSGSPRVGPTNRANGQSPPFPVGPVNCFPAFGPDPGSASSIPPWTPSCTLPNAYGCMDPAHQYGWGLAGGDRRLDFEVRVGGQRLTIEHIVTGQLGSTGPFATQELCRSHYHIANPAGGPWPALTLHAGDAAPTFGTGDGFSDDTIFLCLNPDGGPVDANPGTRGLGTNVVGNLTYTAPGATCAVLLPTATPVPQRPICDLADIGPDPDYTRPVPNAMLSAQVPIVDAARPVILEAATDDRNHNGKIDSARVTLSEPMRPSTVVLANWNLDGRTLTGVDIAGNVMACPATASATAAAVSVFWLCFTEVAGANVFDTDVGRSNVGPRLTYVESGALRDAAGNRPRAYNAPLTDGAPPAVVGVDARADSATVGITMSEGVVGTGGATSLSITYSDVSYDNRAAGGATGFGTNQVVHSPGDRVAVFTLNQAATAADIDADRICFVVGSVREQGAAPVLPLFNRCVPLNGELDDTTPPAAITDLRHNTTRTTATAIVLEWTTPSGDANADLVGFELYVCACAMTSSNYATSGVRVTSGLPTPALGTRQNHTYAPVGTWTSLNFTLVALDAAGNAAASNVHRVTFPDTTDPGTIASITVEEDTSPGGDRVTVSWTAPGDDGATGGKVASYSLHIVQGSGIVPSATNRVPASSLTPDISSPAAGPNIQAPGSRQQVTVSGLTPEVQYTLAVLPVDEAGNSPDLTTGAQVQVTARRDGTTAAACGDGLDNDADGRIDLSDPGCSSSGDTDETDPAGVPSSTITRRNQDLQDSLQVTSADEGNRLTWDLPADESGVTTQGVQVWLCAAANATSCELLATLAAGTPDFDAASYTDPDGTDGDFYLVTAYYGPTPEQGRAQATSDAQSIPGFMDLTPKGVESSGGGPFGGIPFWVWLVLAAVLVLLVILGIWLANRGKGAPEATDEWTETTGEPVATEPVAEAEPVADVPAEAAAVPAAQAAPGKETHHLTCPKCSVEFAVTGTKPMVIQCPNCGVKGTLR